MEPPRPLVLDVLVLEVVLLSIEGHEVLEEGWRGWRGWRGGGVEGWRGGGVEGWRGGGTHVSGLTLQLQPCYHGSRIAMVTAVNTLLGVS